jgi:uncharacterized protein DUF3471
MIVLKKGTSLRTTRYSCHLAAPPIQSSLTMTLLRRLLCALTLVPAARVAGQTPVSVRLAYENVADRYGSFLARAFDSIPESRYDFRPTPVQQSIGYIAQHLERANYDLCGTFGKMRHPMTAKDSLPDSIKARWPKDTLVRRLKASLRFCDTALDRVQSFDSFLDVTYLLGFETDLAEHYSQLASYMRQIGMAPPSSLPPAPHTAITLSASALAPLVGLYELGPGLQLEVRAADGALDVKSSVGTERRLYPSSANDFFARDVDAQITFIRDASGAVTGLVLHQMDRERPARKIR